jgi:spore germination protein GerM
MSSAWRQDVLKHLWYSVWGLATLVLLFMVIFLSAELIELGGDPMEALTPGPGENAAGPAARPTSTVGEGAVELYFPAADGTGLEAVERTMSLTDSTVENCRAALDALIAGPQQGAMAQALPASVQVRAMYLLDDGELVVDFSREIWSGQARFSSAALEGQMAFSVVNTLTQQSLQTAADPRVGEVRFLIEGAAPTDAFPAHLDLSTPLGPDRRWVKGGTAGRDAN